MSQNIPQPFRNQYSAIGDHRRRLVFNFGRATPVNASLQPILTPNPLQNLHQTALTRQKSRLLPPSQATPSLLEIPNSNPNLPHLVKSSTDFQLSVDNQTTAQNTVSEKQQDFHQIRNVNLPTLTAAEQDNKFQSHRFLKSQLSLTREVPYRELSVSASLGLECIQNSPEYDGSDKTDDFDVMNSLVVANSKKDKLLKEKERQLASLDQQLSQTLARNEELVSQMAKIKATAKAFMKKSDALLAETQNQTSNLKKESESTFSRYIEDYQASHSQLQELRCIAQERIEELREQVEAERLHCKEIKQQLSDFQHTIDFLRDKVDYQQSELLESKVRVGDLERASALDKTTCLKSLDLLETSRTDVSLSVENMASLRAEHVHLLESKTNIEVQLQLKEALIADMKQEAAKMTATVENLRAQLGRASIDLAERKARELDITALTKQFNEAKTLLQSQDTELAVVQARYADYSKQNEELKLKLGETATLKEQLEQSAQREAAIHARFQEHISFSSEQKLELEKAKQKIEGLQEELVEARSSSQRLSKDIKISENRFDEQKISLRAAKEEIIVLQDQFSKAQETIEGMRSSERHTLDAHQQERNSLQASLDESTKLLRNSHEDTSVLRARITELELRLMDNSTQAELQASLSQLKHDAALEKQTLQQELNSLQIQLKNALSMSLCQEKELKLKDLKIHELETERGNISENALRNEEQNRMITQQVSDVLSELQQLRITHEETISAHLRQLGDLHELRLGQERTYAESQTECAKFRLRIETLEDQLSSQKHETALKVEDAQRMADKWDTIEKRLEFLAVDLINNKTLTQAEHSGGTNESVDLLQLSQLQARAAELSSLAESLTAINTELLDKDRTILERHKHGQLTINEANFVKEVINATIQMNQKELVQKDNEIKRRDGQIRDLYKRMKELELQLSNHLGKQGVSSSLAKLQDFQQSSPLSPPGPENLLPLETKVSSAPVMEDSHQLRSLAGRKVAQDNTSTFSHLNREKSDEIDQFSDPAIPLPFTRGAKRAHEQEDHKPHSRPTRRPRLGGVDDSNGKVPLREGESSALAKYKAQRGKLRR